MQVEEADHELTKELLGGSNFKAGKAAGSGGVMVGIAGASLKNKQDHINFGITVAAKLSDSTPFCISAFYKELTDRVKNDLSLENLNEILGSLTTLRDDKKKKEDAAKATTPKVSAKDLKKKKKAHEETFGGGYDEEDEYDNSYGKMEDDYMF